MELNTGQDVGGKADDAEPQVLRLFLLTGAMLVLGDALLSGSAAMTIAACKLYSIVLALSCSGSLLWRRGMSVELTLIIITAYMALALWVGHDWIALPLIVATVAFLGSAGLRPLSRTFLCPTLWLNAGIGAALILSVTHYADFLIIEKIRHGGQVYQDTLFHASIASMIKTYGAVSTGLHGLVETPYHVLSHRLFAALSILSGVPVLEVYGTAQIILLCPLLLASATWCTCRVRRCGSPTAVARTWLIVCAILILLKLLPLDRFDFGDTYFYSESYTLSLFYLLLALPAVLSADSTVGDNAIAGALIVLAGLSKGSVGVVGLTLLWAKAILFPGSIGRSTLGFAATFTSAAFVYLMGNVARNASTTVSFNPFLDAQVHGVFGGSLREAIEELKAGHVPAAGASMKASVSIATFFLANFVLSWVVVVWRYRVGSIRAVLTHEDAAYSLVAVSVGVGTSALGMIGGWYFVNPAMFVSLPFVAVLALRRLEAMPAMAARGLTVAVVLGVSFLVADGYRGQVGVFMKSKRSDAEYAAFKSENIDALLALRDKEHDHPVVFELDKSFSRIQDGWWHCAETPFFYPAITERAWVGVIDTGGQCVFENFGYAQYFKDLSGLRAAPVIPPNARIVPASRELNRRAAW
jgi:hypothetical protein